MSDEPLSYPRSFETLAEAIDFIAECVESGSALTLFHETLASQVPVRKLVLKTAAGRIVVPVQPEAAEHFADWVFPRLCQQQERMDLRARYSDRDFPPDAERLKLGGHDSELGHVHIDFIRRDEGWCLEQIWECR
jgi:hypothetical protein